MSPRDVLQAAVDRWPQFDDSHAEDDGSVDGGDMVEWFGEWVDDAKAAIAADRKPPAKPARSTHSDLAREVLGLATKLAGLPGSTPNADVVIQEMLTATARILLEQDDRIGRMTVALREARSAIRESIRAESHAPLLRGSLVSIHSALSAPAHAPRIPRSAGPAEQIKTGD